MRALRRAGVLGLQRGLDGVTPEDIDQWLAFERIEPDPDLVTHEILIRGIVAICAALGKQVRPEELRPTWGQAAPAVPARRRNGTRIAAEKVLLHLVAAKHNASLR